MKPCTRREGVVAYLCVEPYSVSSMRIRFLIKAIGVCPARPKKDSPEGLPERGRESPGLALLAREHTGIWLEREDLSTSLLLCPGKMFRQGN
jgi:hypothetical protein